MGFPLIRATAACILAASFLSGCGDNSNPPANPAKQETAKKTISGAGATFPYPLYAKWAEAYARQTGLQMNYQSIGSGGGIKQIQAGTVDFGATDKPLEPAELDRIGVVQFPTVMGGVVPVVNLPQVPANTLRLSGAVLADVYLGKITRWNDQAIAALNPGVSLPNTEIAVVHRSDGSGTTWIFTNYLSKVSSDWKSKVGNDASVAWPTGIGGKGNEGVASYVMRVKGAIGYVEYAYALQNRMNHVLLKNPSGNFVQPDAKTFQAAAANADWTHAPGFYMVLTDQPGRESWPITGATFILMHRQQSDPDKAKAVLGYFDWAYENGDKLAEDLDYIPLPENVVELIRASWAQNIHGPGGQPVWTVSSKK